ncbi:fimbrial chaperone protein PefD [Escherichia coli]|uniref:Fimbrial chaperone protein PefD n=1 Tax=Escherichia coli TaxID=562 RepID=A0A376JUU4_ECOLX|nr:fimbrial chaperone protein PefD [Escherichia coli]
MNKLGKVALTALLSVSFCNQAMAAFVLNGTRFIYEEGKKNVSFEVTNNADKPTVVRCGLITPTKETESTWFHSHRSLR